MAIVRDDTREYRLQSRGSICRGGDGLQQGSDLFRRAEKQSPRHLAKLEHLTIDGVFHGGIDAPAAEVLQAEIDVAIDFGAGTPGAQIGVLTRVVREQVGNRSYTNFVKGLRHRRVVWAT